VGAAHELKPSPILTSTLPRTMDHLSRPPVSNPVPGNQHITRGSSQVLGYFGLGLGIRVLNSFGNSFGFTLRVSFVRGVVLMGNLSLSFPVPGVNGLYEFLKI